MTGTLHVIGVGPGDARFLTPQAQDALAESRFFFGYRPYLDRLAIPEDLRGLATDNREELDRARAALDMALDGQTVAMVSGGDPGVFAMAAAVCEAIEAGPERYRTVPVNVVPGITAMLAAAARAGAPLGHDFAAISLSDNLKPWSVIEKRLTLVAEAGMAMAFYNPISRARPHQLGVAFEVLRRTLPGETVVVFARAVGRDGETMVITTLGEADALRADMATLVIVGSADTRVIERPALPPLVYTPRFVRPET